MLEKALYGSRQYYLLLAAIGTVVVIGAIAYMNQFFNGLQVTGLSRDVPRPRVTNLCYDMPSPNDEGEKACGGPLFFYGALLTVPALDEEPRLHVAGTMKSS